MLAFSFVTATPDDASVSTSIFVRFCESSVCCNNSDTNAKRSKTAAFSFEYLLFSLAEPKSSTHAAAAQRQRYNDGHTCSSCLSASGHGVCVRCWIAGTQQEIEPPPHFQDQCNNETGKYGPHTTVGIISIQLEKQNQYQVQGSLDHITPGAK